MTVMNILNNTSIQVDFSDENITIERKNYAGNRYTEG
jgi:hypothetical protein